MGSFSFGQKKYDDTISKLLHLSFLCLKTKQFFEQLMVNLFAIFRTTDRKSLGVKLRRNAKRFTISCLKTKQFFEQLMVNLFAFLRNLTPRDFLEIFDSSSSKHWGNRVKTIVDLSRKCQQVTPLDQYNFELIS